MNSKVTGISLPWVSKDVIDVVTLVPIGALVMSAGRLPPRPIVLVGTGANTWPSDTERSPAVVLLLIWPATAPHPCTIPPSGVTRLPEASNANAPDRV